MTSGLQHSHLEQHLLLIAAGEFGDVLLYAGTSNASTALCFGGLAFFMLAKEPSGPFIATVFRLFRLTHAMSGEVEKLWCHFRALR